MGKYSCYLIQIAVLVLLLACVMGACRTPSELQIASERPAEFEVVLSITSPNEVMVGDKVTATAIVTNIGDSPGIYTAILKLDDQETDKQESLIEPGMSKELSFEVVTANAGSHTLMVGDSNCTFNVRDWCPYTISYYDDSDCGSSGTSALYGVLGHIVHFTPPTVPFRIEQIRFGANVDYSSGDNSRRATVRIWNEDKTRQLWSGDTSWTGSLISVPSIIVDEDFHVELVTYSSIPTYEGGSQWSRSHAVHHALPLSWCVSMARLLGTSPTTTTHSGISSTGQLVKTPKTIYPLQPPYPHEGEFEWDISVSGVGKPIN